MDIVVPVEADDITQRFRSPVEGLLAPEPSSARSDVRQNARVENRITGGEFHEPVIQVRTVGELHVHNGLASTSDRLAEYLRAAARAAVEHPYPAVLPGVVPPLARIHLRRTVCLRTSSTRPAESAYPSIPVDEVLGGAVGVSVIVAEPGGGKTSLLRMHLAEVSERWLRGERHEALPVLVHASALIAGPLADCLARAVSLDLEGLAEGVSAEFFRQPPATGTQWLVLIDGLDELIEPRDQERVLRRAVAWQQSHEDRYRFVITSRPLPDRFLRQFVTSVVVHELQSFGPAEIEKVANSWFEAFGLSQPEAVAKRFLAALRQAGLTALASAPLMIAMLCQLHAASPADGLPADRGALYERFTELLRERRRPDGPTAQALAKYGPTAVTAADHVLDELWEHLAAIAHSLLFSGHGTPAVLELLAKRVTTPARVPHREWQDFLTSVLLSTGLLTATVGGGVTTHRSVLEFLAARHATRIPAVRDAELRRAFRSVRHRALRAPRGIRPRLGRLWPCSCPDLPDSYVGFLIDTVPEQAARHLDRLATGGAGQYGCWFIIDQSRLGTGLPVGAVDTALRELRFEEGGRSRPPKNQVGAAVAMAEIWAELGDARGAEVLAGLAANPRLEYAHRGLAARVLAGLGDARGADELHALVASRERVGGYRRVLAEHLVEVAGVERGIAAYQQAIADPSATHLDRVFEAMALAKAVSARAGSEELYALATNLELVPAERFFTAWQLATTAGDPRGVELLHAEVAGVGLRMRLLAISYLSDCPGGVKALRELAEDSTLPRLVRWAARRAADRERRPGLRAP
ncbi:NACHT domain-containing protein [Streptomyces sp. NPDC004291]